MIKYNIGCGKRNWGKEWVHVDAADFPHIDSTDAFLTYTPNNYIDLIVSAHLIAYFSPAEAEVLLMHWYAKLKPGGTLRVSTPDFDVLSRLYQSGLPLRSIMGPLYGQMAMNTEIIYHKYTWDEKTLTTQLEAIGFTNIGRYDHRKTEHPNTGNRNDFYDDHSAAYINGTLISLNMQAIKPLS